MEHEKFLRGFRPRQDMFNIGIDNLTLDETVKIIKDTVVYKLRPLRHVAVNVDLLVKTYRDHQYREIVNSADLVNADGMPIIWSSHLIGKPLRSRVTGIDLFERLIEVAADLNLRVYLLGAQEAIVKNVCNIIVNRYKKNIVCGYRNGYWHPEEEETVVDEVRASAPDMLFVALSSPAKEIFIHKHFHRLSCRFVMGVGGSFDVFSGKIPRAPKWVQTMGLEWFYRFLCEPKRMFKRYFIEDLLFVKILFREFFYQR